MAESDLLDSPSDALVRARQRPRNITLAIFGIIVSFAMLAGAALSFLEIESIVGSGPIVFCISLAMLIIALVKKNVYAIVIGASGMTISASVALVIFVYHLGPSDAREPIPLLIIALGVPFCIATVIYTVKEFQRSSKELLNQKN